MSGPYCKTCVYYYPAMLGHADEGECLDPAKRITGPAGDTWNNDPFVHEHCSCRNHETKPPTTDGKP